MATEELLKSFNTYVEEYAKHRTYIERARSQAHKFSSNVVEKVILDHEIISSEIADKVVPLVPELERAIGELLIDRDSMDSTRKSLNEKLEELTLRQLIGELTDEEYAQAGDSMKAELEETNGRLEKVKEEKDILDGALQKWIELAERAGQDSGKAKEAPPAPTPAPAPIPEPVVIPEPPVEPAEEEEPAPPEVLVQENEGSHSSHDRVVEDVSSVFGATQEMDVDIEDPQPEPEMPAEHESVIAIETDEGASGDDSAEIDFGYSDEAGEVEIDLGSAAPRAMGEVIDISAMVEGGRDESPASAQQDLRRALLLYQEGTPEEQIYPFTGDVLTVGRGRDNDIQIKNDSKVSRFHCRVFRRGPNFYIEDNKSSNGTLVNGELITERRLFGGEEIIIGETFFRFRIMD